jgi:hypothetical protein
LFKKVIIYFMLKNQLFSLVVLATIWLQLFGYQGTPESQKTFSFEAGYAGLWRTPLKRLEFVTDGTLYSESHGYRYTTPFPKFRFNYSSGVRGALEWIQSQSMSLEVVYTGLFHFNQSDSATFSLSNYYVPIQPYSSASWQNLTNLSYSYKSNLNSGELSFWNFLTPRYIDFFSASWMLGVRYIDFRDKFYITSTSAGYTTPASIFSINQMLGGQIGVQLQCNPTSRFTWAVQAKGGAYADFVKRSSVFYQNGTQTVLFDNVEHRVRPDYTLELIPYIMYRLNPFFMKLAYDKIILFNPVFSPLQLKPSKSIDEVYTNNFVNFQMVYASFGFYW